MEPSLNPSLLRRGVLSHTRPQKGIKSITGGVRSADQIADGHFHGRECLPYVLHSRSRRIVYIYNAAVCCDHLDLTQEDDSSFSVKERQNIATRETSIGMDRLSFPGILHVWVITNDNVAALNQLIRDMQHCVRFHVARNASRNLPSFSWSPDEDGVSQEVHRFRFRLYQRLETIVPQPSELPEHDSNDSNGVS